MKLMMKIRRLHVAVLACVALISACGGSDSPPPQDVEYTDVTLTLFRPFAPGEYVFRTSTELDAALRAAPFERFPIGLVIEEPPVPQWDFRESMIVGISLGRGPWCTAPRVVKVVSDGTDLTVHYEVRSSGTLACMKLAPLIGFVRVRGVPGRIGFQRTDLSA